MSFPALWQRVKASLWVVPALLTLALGLLAIATVWVDHRLAGSGVLLTFTLAAGADGARGVLMTIAGSLITVTGVVFSITIVALQLASSQFTPRVLRSFRADRANQVVLGVFIGTFTYALIVLGTVRSQLEDADRFVPVVSVTIAVALSLVSIGFLIFFINHIASSIQAEVIIDRVTREALDVVHHLFPDEVGASSLGATGGSPEPQAGEAASPVCADRGGYLQEVSEDALLDAAATADVTVRMLKRVGEFVLPGEALATIRPPAGPSCHERVRGAFVIGSGRTSHQDVERGLIELTDIAVRALSPGVNDPTTAIVCIDRITQVLAALGARRFPDLERLGPDGRVRLIARRASFEHSVRLAYGQLRHHGAGDPAIAARLALSLNRLAERLPPGRREVVAAELRELSEAVAREIPRPPDRARALAAVRAG